LIGSSSARQHSTRAARDNWETLLQAVIATTRRLSANHRPPAGAPAQTARFSVHRRDRSVREKLIQ